MNVLRRLVAAQRLCRAAAVIIRATFGQDKRAEAGAVATLFDSTIGALSGGEKRGLHAASVPEVQGSASPDRITT
jgi:hypothetical protein